MRMLLVFFGVCCVFAILTLSTALLSSSSIMVIIMVININIIIIVIIMVIIMSDPLLSNLDSLLSSLELVLHHGEGTGKVVGLHLVVRCCEKLR